MAGHGRPWLAMDGQLFRPNFPAKLSNQIFRPNFPAEVPGRIFLPNFPAKFFGRILRPNFPVGKAKWDPENQNALWAQQRFIALRSIALFTVLSIYWPEDLAGKLGGKICRKIWPENLFGTFGQANRPENLAGKCGREIWPEKLVFGQKI